MPRKELVDRIKNGIEGKDYVLCAVEDCGEKLRVVPRHARIAHGLNGQEYRTKYPEAPIICEATKRILQENMETFLPEPLRALGRETARRHGLLPSFPDKNTKALEQAKGRVRARRELKEVYNLLKLKGLISLNEASQLLDKPYSTLFSAFQDGRLAGEKVRAAGRQIVGIDPTDIEPAFQAGRMKRNNSKKE